MGATRILLSILGATLHPGLPDRRKALNSLDKVRAGGHKNLHHAVGNRGILRRLDCGGVFN